MDNTGNYVSIAQLLAQLPDADKAERQKTVLSNKAVVSGTKYQFEFTGDSPEAGDFVLQGDNYGIITNVSGSTLEVDPGDEIENGKAKFIITDFDEAELESFIKQSMAFIDRHTRQWFNARTFDSSNPIKMEGNNSRVLFFQVPIIQIDTIKKTPESQILPKDFYQVFNSRTMPDDRRNPMIKLIQEDDDPLFITAGKFMRGQFLEITGTFGFLEPDGSTPQLIQRASLKLALMYAAQSLGESALSSTAGNVGPIKREKTDMHEIEYHNPEQGSDSLSAGTGLSGDDEVDDIIASYKSPIIVSGSFPDIGLEAPRIPSLDREG